MIKRTIAYSVLLLACSGDTGVSAEDLANHSKVTVWLTSQPSDPFTHRTNANNADRKFHAPLPNVPTIKVDDSALRQEVEGFGAALTDASAGILWYELTADERARLLEELMSESKGLGLDMLRLPIAASDSTYSGRYSYDDGPADPSLSSFSIDHDRKYILPILADMLGINDSIRIVATPWSPPGWMKTSDSMIGGSLRSEYRQAYADYLVKFVRAYWEYKTPIPIYAITPQNEPGQPANYPSMDLPEPDEATLVTQFIAPTLDKAHFGWVKILGFDHNWGDAYPVDLLNDTHARAKLDGVAFHCYGGDKSAAMSALHAQHPDKDIYLTECDRAETPSGQNSGHGEGIEKLIRAMNNWSRTYMAWQLVLRPDGTPNQGSGCRHLDAQGNVVWHCVGVVSVSHHTVTKEWDYAYLGHASKFVKRGARVVATPPLAQLGVESVAFVNPDGSRVLVAYNASESDRSFQVEWHSNAFNATIPKRSAATFVW